MRPHALLFPLALAMLAGCSTPRLQPREGHVAVPGGQVWFKIVGSGPGTPLLLLHGGPGAPSHYLDRLGQLGDERPVIFYDQLGCGRSDRPSNTNLWRVERFVEELAAVRRALGLKRVHLFGHSWGTMLATDYLLTRPRGVRSVTLASPCLSAPRFVRDANELRAQLPPDVQLALQRHEAAGTTDSTEYQAAVAVFMKRHLCRQEPWPPELTNAIAGFGDRVYNFMWGPSEFHVTGTLKDYDRTSRLAELHLPVLYTTGRFDETTPATTAWYQGLTPNARLEVFEQSAHMPMLEETDRYLAVMRAFLREVERGK
jgi:proline iminopeptidase